MINKRCKIGCVRRALLKFIELPFKLGASRLQRCILFL